MNVTQRELINALDIFRGEISQIPPMYSAVSVDGKRLYDLARQGIEVERQARQAEIKRLELTDFKNGEYTIDVLCTKGTYIRTLIDDIGKALGCGAVMTGLTRTLASGFTIDDCITLEELQRRKDNGITVDDAVIDIEKLFMCYDDVYVSAAQAKRFLNGGALAADRLRKKLSDGLYRVYSADGLFLGIGEADTQKRELSVKRLLVRRD